MSVGLALLAFVSFVQTEGGTRIDRVVAVVESEVITEAELVLEARIALARRGAIRAASKAIDERFVETFLDYLVNQLLVANQATRLGAFSVSDQDVEREFDRFADSFPSRTAFDSFLRRFGISDERLRGIMLRDLRNGRFVNRRMNVRLMGQRAPGSPEYQEALELWLSELRQAATIRVLGP
ncbi:MAG: SurA N-terminal domain-containing protein, partial [Myxococcota bacterium]